MATVDWEAFTRFIHAYQSFVLTSHIRPDCDALGSELGMARILETLGKTVRIINGHPTPPNLQFIDPERRILTLGDDVSVEEACESEALLILDTSAWTQLGPMGEVVKTTTAAKGVLDHHVGEDELGAELFKNTTAEATGRLVVDAAEQLGVELTPEISKPVFAALATDTGWYRFSSVTASTYRTAAKLVDGGANPAQIYGELYERETPGRLRLRGLVLARATFEESGLAYTHIRTADFEETGALPSDTEDLVNLLLSVDGAKAAVILVEQADGGFKISFRSQCELDCSQVASSFGGGGHKAAAGALIQGEFEDVRSRVLDAVRKGVR